MRIFPDNSSQLASGSVLIIVLWVVFGLVAVTIYFANAMSFELRAASNNVSGIATDEAINGAARYVNYILTNLATNGAAPDPSQFQAEAVQVGDAHFWLIGRDTNDPPAHPDQLFFGLVDEGAKLNLNTATNSMLELLPRMTSDLAANIVTWRSSNADNSLGGAGSEVYAMQNPPYLCKSAPFETVDELRLVYGMDMDTLYGEDANRNGILDPNETDVDRNGQLDPGVLEYVTVYSREPNTLSDGSAKFNVARLTTANSAQLRSLLQTNLSSARANQILTQLGFVTTTTTTGGRGATTTGGTVTIISTSPLQFYARSGMTADEFAIIGNQITVTTNSFIEGRININTAPAAVLACIPGLTNRAEDVVSYRVSNPDKLTSTAWIFDALSLTSTAEKLQLATQIGDRITTHSYQFTADIAAIGPFGRGYRRVRFVFDLSEGAPKIIYRRDVTHLGWALGKTVRQTWLAKATP